MVGDQAKQGEALLALGLAERLHGLQQLPGQQLAEALQRREALLRLVDPAGLGAFRWLTSVSYTHLTLPTISDV